MARELKVDVSSTGVRFDRGLKSMQGSLKSWANSFKSTLISMFGAAALLGAFRAAGTAIKEIASAAERASLPLDQFLALRDIARESRIEVDKLASAFEALDKAKLGITRQEAIKEIRSLPQSEVDKKYGETLSIKQIDHIRNADSSIENLSNATSKFGDTAEQIERNTLALLELEETKKDLYLELAPALSTVNILLKAFLVEMKDAADWLEGPKKTGKRVNQFLGNQIPGFSKIVSSIPELIARHVRNSTLSKIGINPKFYDLAKLGREKYNSELDRAGKKEQLVQAALENAMRGGKEPKQLTEEERKAAAERARRQDKQNVEDVKDAEDQIKELEKDSEDKRKEMAEGAFGKDDLSVEGGFLGKNLNLIAEQNLTFFDLQRRIKENSDEQVRLLRMIVEKTPVPKNSQVMEEWAR